MSTAAARLRRPPLHDFDATRGYPGEGHRGRSTAVAALALVSAAPAWGQEFNPTRGFPGEGHRTRNVTAHLAFWNAVTLREAYTVRCDGTLKARGDLGKLSMLLGALDERGIYACGIAEHRLMGDAIEDLPGDWTFVRTCTGVTHGPGYCGGVGILLSPTASRQWRRHGRVANQASGWNVSVELPVPGGAVATMISYRWPPIGNTAAERERRAAAMRETYSLVSALPGDAHVILCGDANGSPGDAECPGVTGRFGQGQRSRGGEQLVELAEAL